MIDGETFSVLGALNELPVMSAMTIQQQDTQHCIHTMIFLLQMPESLCFMSMSKEKRLWSLWIYVIIGEMLE